MSKIAILTDTHIGINKDSTDRLNDIISVVDEFIRVCKEQKVYRVYFAGDWFHNRNYINSHTINIGIDLLERISSNFPVTLVLGNHDMYFKHTNDVHSLKFFEKFPIDKIEIVKSTQTVSVDNKTIHLIPWLGAIPSTQADLIIGHINAETEAIVKYYVKVRGSSKDLQEDVHSYLAEHGLAEMIQSDEVTKSAQTSMNDHTLKAKNVFSALKEGGIIFSGHFHMHDEFSRFKKRFIWVGSPYEQTWTDEGNPKGFYIVDMQSLEATFFQNLKSPIHRTIHCSKISTEEEKNSLAQMLISNRKNFLKVVISSELSYEDRVKINQSIQQFGNIQNIEVDANSYNQIGSIDASEQGSTIIPSSKFDYVKMFLETIPIDEFTRRSIKKEEVIDRLHTYFVNSNGTSE